MTGREPLASGERVAGAIGLGLQPGALTAVEPPGQIAAAPLLQHVRDLVAQALASLGGREMVVPVADIPEAWPAETRSLSCGRSTRL